MTTTEQSITFDILSALKDGEDVKSYAVVYHKELYQLWSDRLITHPNVFDCCPYSDQFSGLIVPHMLFDVEEVKYTNTKEISEYSWHYKCRFLFCRYMVFNWIEKCIGEQEHPVNIFRKMGIKVYLQFLWLEVKERITSFFSHRENLDIIAPYILGFSAILSYLFNPKLIDLLQFLT